MPPDKGLEEVRQFTAEFIAATHLEVAPEVRLEEGAIVIEFSGPDEELLLARHGELLESLQFLLGKVLQRQFGTEQRFLVDCEGFRLAREQELGEMARHSAERVKSTSEPLELSPMNPYERRIVHLALKDDRRVRTESAGDGFMKRVTIYPVEGS